MTRGPTRHQPMGCWRLVAQVADCTPCCVQETDPERASDTPMAWTSCKVRGATRFNKLERLFDWANQPS